MREIEMPYINPELLEMMEAGKKTPPPPQVPRPPKEECEKKHITKSGK